LRTSVGLVAGSETRFTRQAVHSAGRTSDGLKNFSEDPRLVLLIKD